MKFCSLPAEIKEQNVNESSTTMIVCSSRTKREQTGGE